MPFIALNILALNRTKNYCITCIDV